MKQWSLVLVGLIILVSGIGTASGAVAGNEGVSFQTNLSDNSSTLWTESVRITTNLQDSSQVALGNVDNDGRLHFAYSQEDAIYYGNITTSGESLQQSQVFTAESTVQDIAVMTERDGGATIVYVTQPDAATYALRRLAIENGSVAFDQTIREATERLTIQDTITGPQGRLFVSIDILQSPELWVLHANQQSINGIEITESAPRGPQLGIWEGSLYVATPTFDNKIRLDRFDLSRASLTRQSSEILPSGQTGIRTDRLFNMVIHPDGILLLSHLEIRQNGRDTILSAIQLTTGEYISRLTVFTDRQIRFDFLVDYQSRTHAIAPTEHVRYTENLNQKIRVPAITGHVAYNGQGYPSLLSVSDGGVLTYRAMIVRSLQGYESPLVQYGSIDEALTVENQRLEQRIEELESNDSSSGSPITDTSAGRSARQTTPTSEMTPADADGDGVPNTDDYAPRDPNVQQKSDIQTESGGQSGFIFASTITVLLGIVLIARWYMSD